MVDVTHLICAGIGFAAPALALRTLWTTAWQPVATAHAYREAAWRLGLDHDTRGTCLYGTLDGREFRIEPAPDGRGVIARLHLRHPMGLGLSVHRASARERLARRRERPRHDPLRDYQIQVLWPPGEAPLPATARSALAAVVSRWPQCRVSDDGVSLRLRKTPRREDEVLDVAASMESLARALESARDELPDPPEVARFPSAELAATLALALAPGPRLTGERGGRRVAVDVARAGDTFAARLRVWVARPMRTGLFVTSRAQTPGRRGVAGLQVPWSHQDIPFGDAAFDRIFCVQAWDRDTVAERFTPEVRRALHALAAEGVVEVDDRSIRVTGLTLDPTRIAQAVDTAVFTASALDAPDQKL